MPRKTRRDVLKMAAGTAGALAAAPAQTLVAKVARMRLAPSAFCPLPLGEVRPTGWLQRQLRVQADGLGGHLDEFWPDVGPNSGWLGGTGESWERGPYFVDGLLPLAWQLNDDVLKAKAMRFVNWTLDHPQPSGMIGPTSNDDWWPRMVMLKVLMQFYQATADGRVIPVMTRYFRYQLANLPARPLRDWGKYRWQDEVLVVEWMYERTGDPDLLRLAALLQQQGFDWVDSFTDFKYTAATTRAFLSAAATGGNRPEGMQTHGVNNGQALKAAAVQYRLSGNANERANYFRMSSTLDRYHGMPSGMFSCDEHLAGLDPSHGTELCTVVETMFSMEVALATFGDAKIADQLEKITFNALCATFTDDMWAHQYDQQPNQVQVSLNSKPWTTNGPESNLYGLEPNFGCCTANFHQGWPKFVTSLWMRGPDDGLVAPLYSPCEVTTKIRNRNVHLAESTDYPFRDTIRIVVTPETAMHFPLSFRIPGWTAGATVLVNGADAGASSAPGSYARVERLWQPGDLVEIKLPMKPRVSRWFNRSIALERGPLVFSLDLAGDWVKLRDRGPTADWQVFPSRPWNFALAVDEESAPLLRVFECPVGLRPFTAEGAAVSLQVSGRQLDTWLSEDGVAAPPPRSPVACHAPAETLTLIPYAAAKLRVTAFPQLKQTAPA